MSQAAHDTIWAACFFGAIVFAGVAMWYFGVWKNRK